MLLVAWNLILFRWTMYGLRLSFLIEPTWILCFKFVTKRVLVTQHVSTETAQATAQLQGFLFYPHSPESRLGMCKRLGMNTAGTTDLN